MCNSDITVGVGCGGGGVGEKETTKTEIWYKKYSTGSGPHCVAQKVVHTSWRRRWSTLQLLGNGNVPIGPLTHLLVKS